MFRFAYDIKAIGHSRAIRYLCHAILWCFGGILLLSLLCSSKSPTTLEPDLVVPRKHNASVGIQTVRWQKKGAPKSDETSKERDLYEESFAVTASYARKWGYPFWVSRTAFLSGPQRNGDPITVLWSKQANTLSILLDELRKPDGERLKWIMFFDADILLVNHNIPLETFIPPEGDNTKDIFLVAAKDGWDTLNSGALFIKVCEDSVKFLTTLVSQPIHNPKVQWRLADQSSTARTAAMDPFIHKVAIVPQEWFNADCFGIFWPEVFPGKARSYDFGDFMIHFMGFPKKGWPEMLDEVHRGNSSLQVPLAETRLTTASWGPESYWKQWLGKTEEERAKVVYDAFLKDRMEEEV